MISLMKDEKVRFQTEVHTALKEMILKSKFTNKEVPLNSSTVIDIVKSLSLDIRIGKNSLNNRLSG